MLDGIKASIKRRSKNPIIRIGFFVHDVIEDKKAARSLVKGPFIRIKNRLTGEDKKSILFFTTHKAASTFIIVLTRELSSLGGFRHYPKNDWNDPDSWKKWKAKNCCYAPLRWLPSSVDPSILKDYNIIVHLRDPRDVLTSLFFSHAYSHTRKKGIFDPSDEQREEWIRSGIEEFILQKLPKRGNKSRAEVFLERYQLYCDHLIGNPNVTFIKYEDMISNFGVWLEKVLRPFDFSDESQVIEKLLEEHKDAFAVQGEDVTRHMRRVIPGDHKNKLTPETIKKVNLIFKDVLKSLDYDE